MVHLLRYGDLSVDQIARELHRSPEAVRWRIVKIVREHSIGQDSTHEAYNWLGLTSDV